MAKNWTIAEAVTEVLDGNKEAILDVGRRFPLTLSAISAMGNNAGALTIIGALPDHITARKIESVLKDGVQESDGDEDAADEKPAKEVKKPVKEEKAATGKSKKQAAVEEDDEDEQDYEEMTAMDLYKLCKERKIKAEPKQKAAAYIKLLKAADAKMNEPEDEDWDEEEDDEPAPKKTSKKPAKEEKAAPAKGKKAAADDDEDWDI